MLFGQVISSKSINVIEFNYIYMSRMISIQVRFPPEDIKRIDNMVENGEYNSRSEYVRDAVRKSEMIRSLSEIRSLINDKGISEEDLVKSGKAIRKNLVKDMFTNEPPYSG